MTHAISLVEQANETNALLQYAAHRLATRSGPDAETIDTVSLSGTTVALIEGQISAAASAEPAPKPSDT